jgi:predicted acylesterase/phospholipase RssA
MVPPASGEMREGGRAAEPERDEPDDDPPLSAAELAATRYVVFGGGGGSVLALLGALRCLRRRGLGELRGAAGVSAGALAALAVCAGAPPAALEELANDFAGLDILAAPDVARLVGSCGLDDGGRLRQLIAAVLARCGLADRTTFADLQRLTGRRLVCVNTELRSGRAFAWDAERTPDAPLRDGLYASMCLPMLLVPLRRGDETHVDGGVVCPIPHGYFPPAETLALALRGALPPPPFARVDRFLAATVLAGLRRMDELQRQLELGAPGLRRRRIDVGAVRPDCLLRLDPRLIAEADAELTWRLDCQGCHGAQRFTTPPARAASECRRSASTTPGPARSARPPRRRPPPRCPRCPRCPRRRPRRRRRRPHLPPSRRRGPARPRGAPRCPTRPWPRWPPGWTGWTGTCARPSAGWRWRWRWRWRPRCWRWRRS